MQVRVLFFGVLKDVLGRSHDTLTLEEGATAGEVLSHYEQNLKQLNGRLSSIAISVNQEYARVDAKLKSGDEVALLPPVSGGSAKTHNHDSGNRVAIVRSPLDSKTLADELQQPEDGAMVVFEGIVRNHSRGRKTLFLDYEAYEEMALKQMEALRENALSQFQIRDAAITHRLGRLQIGETSVLIVVFSAHRAAAFDACRWLIDRLKRTVPIWKREYFEDGAVWADGEPFPELQGTKPELPASK
jgi:molybdopterin converting factor subunit 1